MKAVSFVLAVALGLAGCNYNATLNATVADIKAVAAKLDTWAQAVAAGATRAYTFSVNELPQACSLARTAANIANSAATFSEELNAKPAVRNDLLKASTALSAVGSSNACTQAANGVQPANIIEASSQIVQAFAAVKLALKGTSVSITATTAATGN